MKLLRERGVTNNLLLLLLAWLSIKSAAAAAASLLPFSQDESESGSGGHAELGASTLANGTGEASLPVGGAANFSSVSSKYHQEQEAGFFASLLPTNVVGTATAASADAVDQIGEETEEEDEKSQLLVQESNGPNLDILREFYIYTPSEDELEQDEPNTAQLAPADRLPAMMSSWRPGGDLQLLPRGKGLDPSGRREEGGRGGERIKEELVREENSNEVASMTPRSSGVSGARNGSVNGKQVALVNAIEDSSEGADNNQENGFEGSGSGSGGVSGIDSDSSSGGSSSSSSTSGNLNQLNNQIGAYGIETDEQRALRAKIVKNWKQQQRIPLKTSPITIATFTSTTSTTTTSTTTITPILATTTAASIGASKEAATAGSTEKDGVSRSKDSKWEPSPYCIGSEQPLESADQFHWICQGLKLKKVPEALDPKPVSLRITGTGIEVLKADALAAYSNTLKDFSIENAPRLIAIEPHAFAPLLALRVVYILAAPKLKSFDLALSGLHPQLSILRIHKTGLRWWPDLSHFKQEEIFRSVELDDNEIELLGEKPINIRAGWVNLEFNNIKEIGEFTFNGSEIGALSLSGNRQLTRIHDNAFANLKNLVKLDLSGTSIEVLPQAGLKQLVSLVIKDTYTLRKIPSIYSFPSLAEAKLTYAYHCCAFHHPETHDPVAHEEHLRMQEQINAACASKLNGELAAESEAQWSSSSSSSAPFPVTSHQPPVSTATIITDEMEGSTETSEFEGFFGDVQQLPQVAKSQQKQNQLPQVRQRPNVLTRASQARLARAAGGGMTTGTGTGKGVGTSGSLAAPTLKNRDLHQEDIAPTTDANFDGFVGPAFENLKGKPNISYTIECGELVKQTSQMVDCNPVPDAYSPCEDIMGNMVLRISVWFVVAACVLGNIAVLVVQIVINRRVSVPKFLQLNLAFGDMMMGFYLLQLAIADLVTLGTYFNYAYEWQHGLGCKVAGAAGLFASQLSIFTLMIITFERYYTITYSIDLNMRLHLGWASRIMIFGWIFALGSAMLPALGKVNSYSKTSICLPLRTHSSWDRWFVSVLLSIDFFAFVVIFACYLRMYLLVMRQKTDATSQERRVARRMALLVFTDFACWAPIIFFGASALMGYPLISVSNSKILIVFFYPLNSMANPYLYVLSTRQYRRDLDLFWQKLSIWRDNLLNRNDESYYSANFYAGINHSAAINAHLGAVAAVTGVAHHLHLHEQQVDKGGHYMIRHQILAGSERRADIRSKRQTHLFDEPKNNNRHLGNRNNAIPLKNYDSFNLKSVGSNTLPKDSSTNGRNCHVNPEVCSRFCNVVKCNQVREEQTIDSRLPLACVSESAESCSQLTSSCCPELCKTNIELNAHQVHKDVSNRSLEEIEASGTANLKRKVYRETNTGSGGAGNRIPSNGRCCRCCTRLCSMSRLNRTLCSSLRRKGQVQEEEEQQQQQQQQQQQVAAKSPTMSPSPAAVTQSTVCAATCSTDLKLETSDMQTQTTGRRKERSSSISETTTTTDDNNNKNLCRLAQRQSLTGIPTKTVTKIMSNTTGAPTSTKSVALVNPMQRPITSQQSKANSHQAVDEPQIPSTSTTGSIGDDEVEPNENSTSTEHKGRYVALVDDIFKENFRRDSHRASKRRKSIILGKESLTNEPPTSSTSGCQEQHQVVVMPEVRAVGKSSKSSNSSQKHHRHRHHHHKRRHRHDHRHGCDHNQSNKLDQTESYERQKKSGVISEQRGDQSLPEGSGCRSYRRHRCRSSHHHHHNHNHLHKHQHLHLIPVATVNNDTKSDETKIITKSEINVDKNNNNNEEKEGGEHNDRLNVSAQQLQSSHKINSAQQPPVTSITPHLPQLSQPPPPLESILKSSKTHRLVGSTNTDRIENGEQLDGINSNPVKSGFGQRVGLLLHWRQPANGKHQTGGQNSNVDISYNNSPNSSRRATASSVRNTSATRGKKRVSIMEHFSG